MEGYIAVSHSCPISKLYRHEQQFFALSSVMHSFPILPSTLILSNYFVSLVAFGDTNEVELGTKMFDIFGESCLHQKLFTIMGD